MKLLADSGSTKCDWVLINGAEKEFFKTIGLNPNIASPSLFLKAFEDALELRENKLNVTEIEFYGAGCTGIKNQKIVQEVLLSYFINATKTKVESDLWAAVKATCDEKPAYVAILGTGSNLGFYDGINLHFPTPSLGYILGDEGSGNSIGKQLLIDYFYGKMPLEFKEKLNWGKQITELYSSKFPNAFLAEKVKETSFMHGEKYFQDLVKGKILDFLFLHKKTIQDLTFPIHFVGSISYYFKDLLQECCRIENLKIGKVISSPIQSLR